MIQKHRILLVFACSTVMLNAQSLFTKITDTNNPIVSFTNTAAAYKGASWIDMDGDSWPDLYTGQMFVFKNMGNGQFEQKNNLAGAFIGQGASGSSWGDIDNDGYVDAISALLKSGLHINNGNFAFDQNSSLLPNFTDYSGWDCTLADADNNGLLDLLFVHACCNFHPTGPFPCRFYLQNTLGVFTQVSGYEFTDQNKPYTVPVWSDYDLDGDVDLFIGSGPAGTSGPDFCYKNRLKETGQFSLERLIQDPFDALQDGQTYNFPDYDNDGDLDICLTNYAGAKCRFWNNNNGVYQAVNTSFTNQNQFLSNVWGDMDNDADLDLMITLDQSPNIHYYENKDGNFGAMQILGTADAQIAGIALADYDNDGDLDAYVNGPTVARSLFRNDTLVGNHSWVAFTLEGSPSNRSAIGAVIRIKAKIDGVDRWQIREVSAHNSFQSQNDLRQHFGLKNATTIDTIGIHWPSGLIQHFGAMAGGQFYTIKEGEQPKLVDVTYQDLRKIAINVTPNPATQTIRIDIDPSFISRARSFEIFDTSGKICIIQSLNNSNELVFPITSLVEGVYFIRLLLDNGNIATEKFVKQ